MKILPVEGEPLAAGFLHQRLTAQGHPLGLAADGLPGRHRTQSVLYNCLIIAQMLPGLSGRGWGAKCAPALLLHV